MFKDSAMPSNSIGGSSAGIAPPQREGEIVEGLRALGNAIDSMEGAASNLTQRIAPVLRPVEPSPATNGIGNEQYTPFGLELARLRERIWNVTRMVDEASGRLELP